LRLQALADGATDAQIRYCTKAAGGRPSITSGNGSTIRPQITRDLAALEAEPPSLDAIPNVGQIAVACFLGHRDLRFAGDWRATHPKLLLARPLCGAVPAFARPRLPHNHLAIARANLGYWRQCLRFAACSRPWHVASMPGITAGRSPLLTLAAALLDGGRPAAHDPCRLQQSS